MASPSFSEGAIYWLLGGSLFLIKDTLTQKVTEFKADEIMSCACGGLQLGIFLLVLL